MTDTPPVPPIQTRRYYEEGCWYVVRLAPHERRGVLGVDRRLQALTFETDAGEWVGSVPAYHTVRLEHLSPDDLRGYLDEAIGRR